MANMAGVRAGRAFVEIGAVDKTATVLNQVSMRINRWGSNMIASGQKLVRNALLAFAPIAISTSVFASFDDAMRRVEARSSGTASELAELRQQAKLLGRETSSTARQIANMQSKLAQKGFSRSDIFDITPNVRNLSQAAGEGTDEDAVVAADLVSGNLRAFKLEAKEAGRVADVFAAAVNNSNFDMQGLLVSMSEAAPLANQFGISLEDTVSTLAGMTNLNIDPSKAGTAFKTMLIRLSDSVGRSSFNKELEKLTGRTIDFVDADTGNLRSLPDLLFEIGDAMQGMGTADEGELLSQLFGQRGILGAGALSDGREEFKKLQKTLLESGGVAQATAEKMDAGIGGTFRRIMSAAEGLAIALGESLETSLTSLEDTVTGNLGAWTEWLENNRNIVVGVVLGIAAFAAWGVGLVAFGLILKMIAFTIGLVATAITLLLLPIKLVIGLLALFTSPWTLAAVAIAAFIGWAAKASGAVDGFMKRFAALGEIIGPVIKGITTLIAQGEFAKAWDLAVTSMSLVWDSFIDGIADAWKSFQRFFVETFAGMMQLHDKILLKLQQDQNIAAFNKQADEQGLDPTQRQMGLDFLDAGYQVAQKQLDGKAGEIIAEYDTEIAREETERQQEISAKRKAIDDQLAAIKDQTKQQMDAALGSNIPPDVQALMDQISSGSGALDAPKVAEKKFIANSALEVGSRAAIDAALQATGGESSKEAEIAANTKNMSKDQKEFLKLYKRQQREREKRTVLGLT